MKLVKNWKNYKEKLILFLAFYSALFVDRKPTQTIIKKVREDTLKLISQLELIKIRINKLGETTVFSKSLIQKAIDEQKTALNNIPKG